jgi:hypothetical protein
MAYIAELSTDGRKLMNGTREASDTDANALPDFEKWATAEAEATGKVVHLQVLKNGRVAFSKSYGMRDSHRA